MKNALYHRWYPCTVLGLALVALLALVSCGPRNAARDPELKETGSRTSAEPREPARPSSPQSANDTRSADDRMPAPAAGATRDAQGNIVLGEVELYDPRNTRGRPKPESVTLSPDGKYLAVIAGGVERLEPREGWWLLVLDVTTAEVVGDYGDAGATAARWHPSEQLLIMGNNWSIGYPAYFVADLATGRRTQVLRGGIHPYCWTESAVLMSHGVVLLDAAKLKVIRGGNFGYPVPWVQPHASLMRLSCGPNDRVAAELWADKTPGSRGPAQHLEMYRKVPNRIQWVPTGRVDPKLEGGKAVWYPNNPNWLGSGRLVYLRIYPDQWTHSSLNSKPTPGADTARNRAELWVCRADGTHQRKITTLWDLRPRVETREADWFTIDRAGKTVYYLSWDKIRVLRLKKAVL